MLGFGRLFEACGGLMRYRVRSFGRVRRLLGFVGFKAARCCIGMHGPSGFSCFQLALSAKPGSTRWIRMFHGSKVRSFLFNVIAAAATITSNHNYNPPA